MGEQRSGQPTWAAATDDIDFARLARLERMAPSEPVEQCADQVTEATHCLGDAHVLAWRQSGPAQEVYLPPLCKYSVFVRLQSAATVVQWRAGMTDRREQATGELVIIPPYRVAYFRSSEASCNLHISMSEQLLLQANPTARDTRDARLRLRDCFGVQDPVVASLGTALLKGACCSTAVPDRFAEHVGLALAVHLLACYAEQETVVKGRLSAAELATVMQCMRDQRVDRLSLVELAQLLDMDVYRFHRMFKATTGVAPMRYAAQLRLQEARTMIESTRTPIADIAASVGFFDPPHFTRAFSRYWGFAPSRLRAGEH